MVARLTRRNNRARPAGHRRHGRRTDLHGPERLAASVPEGHTIHRLARDLLRAFGRRPVVASTLQEPFAHGAALLDGATMTRTQAHGKHLFVIFRANRPADRCLHVHLGLYGKFPIHPLPAAEPRGALRLRLENDTRWADLRGPTACELISPIERDAILARLGPDPLRADADPDRAWKRISRSTQPVGALLMAQDVLSGIGNVILAVMPPAGLGLNVASPRSWRA